MKAGREDGVVGPGDSQETLRTNLIPLKRALTGYGPDDLPAFVESLRCESRPVEFHNPFRTMVVLIQHIMENIEAEDREHADPWWSDAHEFAEARRVNGDAIQRLICDLADDATALAGKAVFRSHEDREAIARMRDVGFEISHWSDDLRRLESLEKWNDLIGRFCTAASRWRDLGIQVQGALGPPPDKQVEKPKAPGKRGNPPLTPEELSAALELAEQWEASRLPNGQRQSQEKYVMTRYGDSSTGRGKPLTRLRTGLRKRLQLQDEWIAKSKPPEDEFVEQRFGSATAETRAELVKRFRYAIGVWSAPTKPAPTKPVKRK